MKRIVLIGIGVVLVFGGNALADGKVDIWNSAANETTNEAIDIYDVGMDASYMPTPEKVHAYLSNDPNGVSGKLRGAGVNGYGYFLRKLFLTADSALPDGSDNFLDVNWNGPIGGIPDYFPLNMEGKNIIMRQAKETPRTTGKNPNIQDLIEMTDEFTTNAPIWLPNITASTPRSPAHYDVWDFIATNWTDIDFNGKVNSLDFASFSVNWSRSDCDPSNNYCDFSDIDGSGTVDILDLIKIAEEWLWDGS